MRRLLQGMTERSIRTWRWRLQWQAEGPTFGLGILSAARALSVDFVPLLEEQYDLVIPVSFYESELMEPVLGMIRSEEFRRGLDEMGGYDTGLTGRSDGAGWRREGDSRSIAHGAGGCLGASAFGNAMRVAVCVRPFDMLRVNGNGKSALRGQRLGLVFFLGF